MPLSTIQLIVIDDDEVDVESIVRSLNRNGIFGQITVFHDGQTALRALQGPEGVALRTRPLLILLDLDLPRLSGIEFLDALRRDPHLQSTIVVVMTLSDRQEDKLAAYERQVAGYFLKAYVVDYFSIVPRLRSSCCRRVTFQAA